MVQVEKISASSGLITTSHNPSHFLRKLSKLLTFSLPNSVRINRGSLNKKQLRNYCWNNKIPRLIIVKGSEKKDSAILEFYNLEKSQSSVNSLIEVADIIFPIKGVKDTRIDTNQIILRYSIDIPSRLREGIDSLMKPFLISNTNSDSDFNLEINITSYDSTHLVGNFSRTGNKENLEILTFRITPIE